MQKRLPGVDGLRGLAILMVTGFHLWLALGRIQVSVGPLHATPLLAYGAAGVGLFFVISGYSLYSPVAAGRWSGTQAFYRRRAVRLLPAYYLALLLWLPWWINFKGGWHESGALAQLLTHMTFKHPFSPTTFGGDKGSVLVHGDTWSLRVALPPACLGNAPGSSPDLPHGLRSEQSPPLGRGPLRLSPVLAEYEPALPAR